MSIQTELKREPQQSCMQLQWVGASDGILLFLLLNSFLTEIKTIFTIKSSNNSFYIAKNLSKSLLLLTSVITGHKRSTKLCHIFSILYTYFTSSHIYMSSFSYTTDKFSFSQWGNPMTWKVLDCKIGNDLTRDWTIQQDPEGKKKLKPELKISDLWSNVF